MSALTIENLSCAYQRNTVLESLDLVLNDNEIVCLLGESGCGKTTLLRGVAGLQTELTGKIAIQQKSLNDSDVFIPPELRKIGLIFQDYALFPHLNVFDNVAFSLSQFSNKEKQTRVQEALDLVKLGDLGERFPHQLSGGQQQRIAIARAMAYQPDLMLLDEPFSNLDQHVRFQLIHDIRELFKQRHMSALLVTHSKEEGFAFADRIALMRAGKIIQIDTPQNLYQRPITPYVADFMGQTNYIEAEVVDQNSYKTCVGLLSSDEMIKEPSGQKLRLLLRPEHLALASNINGEAVIKLVEFQGALQQITVHFKGQDFVIRHSNHNRDCIQFNVGDKVDLNILNHDLITFPL